MNYGFINTKMKEIKKPTRQKESHQFFNKPDNKTNDCDMINQFEVGLIKDKFKRLNLRKDAFIFLQNKEKHQALVERINKENNDMRNKSKLPFLELKNGDNLFEQKISKIKTIRDIYEIKLSELSEINIDLLSHLQTLSKLKIKFSDNFNFNSEAHLDKSLFFKSLMYLDLSFNKLNGKILDYIKSIKTLSKLNLCGNLITNDIPNLSELQNLKKLNLSYNKLSSKFLFLDKIESEETIDKHIEYTESIKWPSNIKTDIQIFFNTLSCLKKLEDLNLSHNKIHFFDIDYNLFEYKEAFCELKKLDLSYNNIEEELGIILVVKIPKLEYINLVHNPIYSVGFSNVEYEIFRNKNITFARIEDDKKIYRKIIKGKNHEELLNKKNYIISKENKESTHKFSEFVKKKINMITQFRNLSNKEEDEYNVQNENEEEGENILLENYKDFINESKNVDQNLEKTMKNKNSNLFLTNDNQLNLKNKMINKKKLIDQKINTYDQFLELANKCFGKEIHYKKSLPIIKAYSNLRFILSNLSSNINLDENISYMKPTISKQLHLYKESNDVEKTRIGKK
jgi:hypothetical protein